MDRAASARRTRPALVSRVFIFASLDQKFIDFRHNGRARENAECDASVEAVVFRPRIC
jgi:hypothetical protein